MTIEEIRDNFDKGDCWEWRSGTNGEKCKYGKVYLNKKVQYVHRVMWEDTYGPIPKDMYVLHKCDNPICGRPDHLFLGTIEDNTRDCVEKGRNAKGTSVKGAKLNETQVLEIRGLIKKGKLQKEIAKEFGVGREAISKINTGSRWAWLS